MRTRQATVRGGRARSGMTVIELLISATVLAIVLGVPAMLLRSGSNAYATETASTGATEQLRMGVSRITKRLEAADGGSVSLLNNVLDYQRGIGYGAGGPILGPVESIEFQYTAADPDDGLDNDGDGLVDEGRVVWVENPTMPNEVRVTLIENVPENGLGEIPGNGADDNGNGLVDEGGLAFELDPQRVRVYLTIVRPGPGGTVIGREVERWVSFRN